MKSIELLEKLFNSIKGVLQLIDSKIRLWGAIILFISSILILLLFSDKIPFNEWYVYLFFIVIIIIALGIALDLIVPHNSKSFKKLQHIESQISRTWGEFMRDHEYTALSIIKIRFNPHLLQFIFEGEAFNIEGEKVADWKSNASAVSQFDPPENNMPCNKAQGWYTSEDISKLENTKKYRVEVLRMSMAEKEMLKRSNTERSEFIRKRVKRWKI